MKFVIQALLKKYGYCLDDNTNALCLTGFADDQAVTACSIEGAVRITDITTNLLLSIGWKLMLQKAMLLFSNRES